MEIYNEKTETPCIYKSVAMLSTADPMRREILYGTYPWAFDCPGGGERQLMAWKSLIEAQGHKVTLYNPWLPIPKEARLFHFFSVMPGSYQLCEYLKNNGLKLVISANLWVTPETKWHYPHDEIKRLVDLADLLIVNSRMEAKSLGEVYDKSEEYFRVVYNGIDDAFFLRTSPDAFVESHGLRSKRYLLNVANVEPRKNQLLFLRALQDYPDILLVVVGNVRDANYLKECQKVGGAQFRYVGPLDYGSEMLRSALAGAAGFVMPSTLETPSIAALEAAAAGCPILITRVGSTTEYFEDNAVYVDPVDEASIREGIGKLLYGDMLSDISSHIHERYTWRASATKLLNVYQDLLGAST